MTSTDWNGRVLKGKSEAFKKAQHFFRIYPYRSPSTVIPHKMIKKQKTKTKKSKKKKKANQSRQAHYHQSSKLQLGVV